MQRGAGAGGEEELELEQVYLAALQDFLHSKTCVLPPDIFAPALAHQWRGSWLPGLPRHQVPLPCFPET